MTPLRLGLVVISAVVAGVMNAIAGGGTLVTFPALIAVGIAPADANATSTVALLPATIGSMWGYRRQLSGARKWAYWFAIPSVLGGALGALFFLRTPPARFAAIVPWLVLGATALFMVQRPALRWVQHRRGIAPQAAELAGHDAEVTGRRPQISILIYQFLVAIYGGYFGAGIGILMLAALGFMGLTNIHRMNGLKSWGGLCMNAIAAVLFVFSSLVNWPVALAMSVGAAAGGYLGSHGAQRVPQELVRASIVVIGLASGILLFFTR